MVRPGRDRLGGKVEVDETYLGAREAGVRGRQTFHKALIVTLPRMYVRRTPEKPSPRGRIPNPDHPVVCRKDRSHASPHFSDYPSDGAGRDPQLCRALGLTPAGRE
jgi:hypothetical protein